jgi:REP element-mobilizing transposase RayT
MFEVSAIYLVTIRCIQGRLFLCPSNETYGVLGGVLARAVRLHGVELFVFNFASNHFHLLVRAPRGNLPQFMQYLLGNISKKVGALVRWRGAFWERRYSAQPVLDDAALLEKVRYVLAHGVKEGLVRRCAEWPGLSALPLMRDGKPRAFRWLNWTRRCRSAPPNRRGDRLDEQWAEPEQLMLTALPVSGFDRLRAVRRFVDDAVAAIEREARRAYRKVMGVRLVLEQSPQHRPTRPARSRAPWCHTTDPSRRRDFIDQCRARIASYREGSASWRRGNLAATFPRGTVRPMLWPVCLEAAEAA